MIGNGLMNKISRVAGRDTMVATYCLRPVVARLRLPGQIYVW